MGRFHVVIETTVRDVLKIMERRRVHPAAVEEIKSKLEKLVRTSLRQDREVREAQEAVPSHIIVRDIVSDLVDKVCNSSIPFVEQANAQRALARQQQELFELRRLAFERDLDDDCLQGELERKATHHNSFQGTMFREVLMLRRQIRQLEERLSAQGQTNGTTAAIVDACAPVSPRANRRHGAPSASPTSRPQSRPQSPRPDPMARSVSPSTSIRGSSSAKLTRENTMATRTVSPLPVTAAPPNVNPLAIFDYEEYVKGMMTEHRQWPEKYAELQKQMQEFVAETNKNAADMAVNYQQSMRRKDQSIAARDRQIKQLKDTLNSFFPRVMNALRTVQSDFEEHVKAIRRDANAQREVMLEWFKKLKRHLAGIDDRFEVFVGFTSHAFAHLGRQVQHLAKRNGAPLPWAAPLWHYFLLQGANDRLEEGKVFWQNHDRARDIVNHCRATTDAIQSIMEGLEPSDEIDELIRDMGMGISKALVAPAAVLNEGTTTASKPSPTTPFPSPSNHGKQTAMLAATAKAAAPARSPRSVRGSTEAQNGGMTPKSGGMSSTSAARVGGGVAHDGSSPSDVSSRRSVTTQQALTQAHTHVMPDTSNRVLLNGKSVSVGDGPATPLQLGSAHIGGDLVSGGFVLGRPPGVESSPVTSNRTPDGSRAHSGTPLHPRAPSTASNPRARTAVASTPLTLPLSPGPSTIVALPHSVITPTHGERFATTPSEKYPFQASYVGAGAGPSTTAGAEQGQPFAMGRKASRYGDLQREGTMASSMLRDAKRNTPYVGSPNVQASFESAAAKLSAKELKLREKLLLHIDRVNRNVIMGVFGRITMKARRAAFFKSLSTAAKNAYMTLTFMDSEVTRMNELIATSRGKRATFEEQVLTLDETARSNADASARAQALAEATKGLQAANRDAKNTKQSDLQRVKSRYALGGTGVGRDGADDATGHGNDESDAEDDAEARLSSAIRNASSFEASKLGAVTSLKGGQGQFETDVAETSGLNIASAVPLCDVYIPTPGAVVSAEFAAASRDLMVRRSLARQAKS